mmetsp:Transcript_66318/g.158223  ORF Transcript_66318/g.158223 Transcript_66318/m.158223 type:complete len:229 (-) Transcript_66318:5-691(-)
MLHPSPLSRLESSHCSSSFVRPLPQVATGPGVVSWASVTTTVVTASGMQISGRWSIGTLLACRSSQLMHSSFTDAICSVPGSSSTHGVQTAAPTLPRTPEYVCFAHGAHDVCCNSLWNSPDGHFVHGGFPSNENSPCGHGWIPVVITACPVSGGQLTGVPSRSRIRPLTHTHTSPRMRIRLFFVKRTAEYVPGPAEWISNLREAHGTASGPWVLQRAASTVGSQDAEV